MPANLAAQCREIGSTQVSVVDRLAELRHDEAEVHDALEALARNSAAQLGGNAITPTSAVVEGSRRYSVLQCDPGLPGQRQP